MGVTCAGARAYERAMRGIPMLRATAVGVLAVLASVSVAHADGLWRGVDLNGAVREIGGGKGTVVVFVGTDCPISNRYVPTLNDIAQEVEAAGVRFYGVISDPTVTRKQAADWAKQYSAAFPIFFDASGELARKYKPTKTPESFVLAGNGDIKYAGRIDDAWAGLGRPRGVVTRKDLAEAVKAMLESRPIAEPKTEAVGCEFE